MKRSLILAITFVTLSAAAATPAQQTFQPVLKDGGGAEPTCPPSICTNPGLQK
jgi:hypothetical protein